jgi:hypothetical protein
MVANVAALHLLFLSQANQVGMEADAELSAMHNQLAEGQAVLRCALGLI